MNRLIYLLLVVTLAQAAVSAQNRFYPERTGLFLDAAVGISTNDDPLVGRNPVGRLGLDYRFGMGLDFALVLGAGLQGRHTKALDQRSCEFIIGNKFPTFSDEEFHRTDELEAYLKLGVAAHFRRLIVEVAALPAHRLGNELYYQRVRTFDQQGRPDDVIKTSFRSGDRILLGSGLESTVSYSTAFNLQALFALQYQLSDRLRIGLAYQPMLTRYTVDYGETYICGVVECTLVSQPQTAFSARVHSGSLAFSYDL